MMVGIPYVDRGRTMSGCDCWGLIKLWYEEEFGIELPDFDVSAMDRELVAETIDEGRKGENWEEVKRPRKGDVVAMSTNAHFPGMVNHVGVYLGPTGILHTTEKTGSMIVPRNNLIWAKRVVGYYRWVG